MDKLRLSAEKAVADNCDVDGGGPDEGLVRAGSAPGVTPNEIAARSAAPLRVHVLER